MLVVRTVDPISTVTTSSYYPNAKYTISAETLYIKYAYELKPGIMVQHKEVIPLTRVIGMEELTEKKE